MTKYTDKQIIAAIKEAGGKKNPGTVYAWELSMYKQVIDALPEPETDEWQQCEFEDIQKGDRVRLVLKNGPLTESPTVIETEPHVVEAHYLAWSRHRTGSTIEASDVQAVYRIPAPVQHPDPEMHAVIIVSGAYDVDWDHAYAFVSDGTGYNIVEPLNSDSRLLPEAIHNWSPAKVVEDDR